MSAKSLGEAIDIQNQVPYGLTAGLHSLDRTEIATWLDRVESGNLYVNRGITGAIVRRQPFGGWKKSAVGPGAKAGGPNYLVALSDWTSAAATAEGPVPAVVEDLIRRAATDLSDSDLAFLRRAVGSDAAAWESEFGVTRDITGLVVEHNHFRYLSVPVVIRFESGTPAELLRVVAAGLRAGSDLRVSVGEPVPEATAAALRSVGSGPVLTSAAAWLAAAAGLGATRIRLVGGDQAALAEAAQGRPEIAIYSQPVVESGRIELLTFLHEQAIAITAHRFGSPAPKLDPLAARSG
jgi:RHH-type proline utilization regulon transcriptional repressor/proline dehydrogenase/delta 1-pyrroline-5-carboxylate dehydrogenase